MINYNTESNDFNPGYAIELENRDYLKATSVAAKFLMSGNLPERMDPRKHPLYQNRWLQTENQGQIGSCQGNSLTECGEFCYGILSNKIVQLSRMYAYLRSQQFDGIRNDNGSTLSGGTKCALEGLCLEQYGPYPNNYPGWNWITPKMKEDAKNYILKSHTNLTREECIKSYLGSGLGIVQIGIAWGNEMSPNSKGCITSFSGRGGGGHAVCFAGYVPDSDINVRSSRGYWYLLKNSWSSRWGVNGWAYVDPSAVSSMLNHRFTVMIGRSDMDVPEPRPIPVDFTKPGNSING